MTKSRSSSLYVIDNVHPNDLSVTIEDQSTSQIRERRRKSLTDEIRTELREIFDLYMDLNTFKVSVRQVEEMMHMYGYHPTKEQFLNLMATHELRGLDDRLTYDMFEKIMSKLIVQRNAANGIMKAFELFDIHNDGCLTFTGLCEVNKMLGGNFSDDDILEMIVEADVDKDGVVDMHDFVAIMKKTDIEW